MASTIPANRDVTLIRGKDFGFVATLHTNQAKTAQVDLTDATIVAKVIDNYNDRNVLATMAGSVIDATGGKIRIFLAKATIDALGDPAGADDDDPSPQLGYWFASIVHGASAASWTVNGAHAVGATSIAIQSGTGDFGQWTSVDFADGNDYEVSAWNGSDTLTLTDGLVAALSGGEAVSAANREYQYFRGAVFLDRGEA